MRTGEILLAGIDEESGDVDSVHIGGGDGCGAVEWGEG